MFRRIFVALAVAAVCCAASGAAAQPASPPLSAYGALPAVEQVTISPDGGRLAYIGVAGEERTLIVRQVGGAVLFAVPVGTAKVRALDFADADRLLITTSMTQKPIVPGWRIPLAEWFQVHSYDLRTRQLTTLMSRTPSTFNAVSGDPAVTVVGGETRVFAPGVTLPETPGISFVATPSRLDLYRIDLTTGVGKIVSEGLPGRNMEWAFGPDGEMLARTHYGEERGRWRLDVREGRGWRSIEALNTLIDRPNLIGLGRDGRSLAMYRDHDGEEQLVEVSLADASVNAVVDEGEVETALFHPATWRLAGVGLIDGEGVDYRFFDPEFNAAWPVIVRAFKGKRVYPASVADDLKRWIVRVEGPANPSTYYLVDLNSLKADYIADAYIKVPDTAIGAVRAIRYAAADGLEIPAVLTLPPGREAKNLPLIVLPHGGPQVRDTLSFDWWSQALASRGYAVLQPNYRGSSGYGLAFVQAGYGEWGRKMQTDLSDGVRHLAGQGLIDPKRVCIMGASYGGYAAMAGATIDREPYRCAVAVAGVSDLRAMLAQEVRDGGERSATVRYWNRFMGVDRHTDRALDEVSPARRAADASMPLLLIHGRDDTVVPYRQSELMRDAMRRAGKPVELITLDGEDHWLSRGETRLKMLEQAVAFVEKHNPA